MNIKKDYDYIIVAFSRYHLFDLADGLAGFGKKVLLLHGYWKAESYLKNRDSIESKGCMLEALRIASIRVRLPRIIFEPYYYILTLAMQLWCLPYIALSGRNSILVCHADNSYLLLALKDYLPIKTFVLDRGSTHIKNSIEAQNSYRPYKARRKYDPINALKARISIYEYKRSTAIAIPSKSVYQTFKQYSPELIEKLHVIPYGYCERTFPPRDKDSDSWELSRMSPSSQKKLGVLFVGSFCLRKGSSIIGEIMEDNFIRENIRLTIVGGISEDSNTTYKRMAKNSSAHFTGHVKQKDLLRYYRCNDVLILPSFEEGMAMIQAQAASQGLYLVISEYTGGEMLIENGVAGSIVKPNDSNSFVGEIKKLIIDKNSGMEMLSNAKEENPIVCLESFKWKDYAYGFLNEFK